MIFVEVRTIGNYFDDVPEKKHLKNIQKKEEEYGAVLGAIEYAIAQYYMEYRHITDKNVTDALKNFRKNYDGAFRVEYPEFAIRLGALDGLEKYTMQSKISEHEFLLVIDYILWAISNRDGISDPRAYLRWVCNYMGLESDDTMESMDVMSKVKPLKIGRNDPCPCGSGKKYKKCCLLKEKEV